MSATFGILTVSDRCSQGKPDLSGKLLEEKISSGIFGNAEILVKDIVPDELILIEEKLIQWSDVTKVDVIITTGGTGFAPRDVTPEATKKVIHKEAVGLSSALLTESLKITPYAMLSRLVCGIRNKTLIINFPGSPKACSECLDILKPVLCHAVSIIKDENKADNVHEEMLSSSCCRSKVDVSCISKRNRISPYSMIEVKEAQKIIFSIVQKYYKPSSTLVDTKDALGRVLSSPIYANDPLPPFPASIKDGYAVIAANGNGKRKVVNASIAGDMPVLKIENGQCVRITTGAPVPSGADAVVQVEDTELLTETSDGKDELEIRILKTPEVGQDIREIGSDIAKGMKVLDNCVTLTSSHLGILASVGASKVEVFKLPRIGILSTGNEIQPFDEELKFGKIRDSNKITLMALLKENGFEAEDCGIVEDDATALMQKIQSCLKNVDVLITSGGVSMGERDILTDVLTVDFKAELHFGRINMKPGKPMKFFSLECEYGWKFIFGLPGNPVSATVTSNLFVLPALKTMTNSTECLPTTIKVKIGFRAYLDSRHEYARGILSWYKNDDVPWAANTGNQMSCRMLSMERANCLLHFPPASEKTKILPSGSTVDAHIIGKI